MTDRKLKLYIAASLDGYIARTDGSLDWLEGLPNPNKIDYGYQAFYQSVDTVIMGRITYEEILGFGVDWPYEACKTWVVSQNPKLETPTKDTAQITGNFKQHIDDLKKQPGKDIWLVGGGRLVTTFLNADLVDEMILFITPVILGEGIALFPGQPKEKSFELAGVQSYETGMVGLTYKKK